MVNAEPFTKEELAEKRRYVESRSARDHWGAAELAHVDDMARWLATYDELDDEFSEFVRSEWGHRDPRD